MLLLGAGSSVPFGISAMSELVKEFKSKLATESSEEGRKITDLLALIESALENSEKLVGTSIPFDLESLMVVLQDLVVLNNRPISTPTFALMLHLITQKRSEIGEYNITNARLTFCSRAQILLDLLRKFIFNNCFKPIRLGSKLQSFSFLNFWFVPLFSTLGNGDFRSEKTQWIFTTNWDLCLKRWLNYALRQIPTNDGIVLDQHLEPVFSPEAWLKDERELSRKIIPLHGSLGLRWKTKMMPGGSYEEIQKITDPERYFEGNPSQLEKAFMIFPLEAVGYEQSVKSPYLDMLNLLKSRLKVENNVFIIGFSLRDSTIASIFEEVLRERAREGDWQPIDRKKSKYSSRDRARLRERHLKVFLIDASPDKIIEALKERGYLNLANALIPIKAIFPKLINDENKIDVQMKDIEMFFTALYENLTKFGLESVLTNIQNGLNRMELAINLASIN